MTNNMVMMVTTESCSRRVLIVRRSQIALPIERKRQRDPYTEHLLANPDFGQDERGTGTSSSAN
jgi:hypothetical protein